MMLYWLPLGHQSEYQNQSYKMAEKDDKKNPDKEKEPKTYPERVRHAIDFFYSRGFSLYASAGIVGNLIAESSVDPKRHQDGGGIGRGIAQWGVNDRWQTFLKFAKNRNISPWKLDSQLRFIIHEMPSQMGEENAKRIKTMTNQIEVAKLFMDEYERPGDPNWNKRKNDTQYAFDQGMKLYHVDRGPVMREADKVDVSNPFDDALNFFKSLFGASGGGEGPSDLDKSIQYFNNLNQEVKKEKPKTFEPEKLEAF